MKSIAVLKNVGKKYIIGETAVDALKEINFDFQEGSFSAIMGPSGSGKSTLLNLLGCLDRPSDGDYILGDKNISHLNDDELSEIRGKYIGFVFQSYNLIPQLTLLENIEVPLFYQGFSEKQSRQRALELAELVGLGGRLMHRPTELSGGQCQRVAVARALANDPLIILADEPTGNLDSKTGEEIMSLLHKLHSEGKTLILVTHDKNISQQAERILHLLDGQLDKEETMVQK